MDVAIPFVFLVILLILGIPIGFALGGAGMLGIWIVKGNWDVVMATLKAVPFNTVGDYNLTTVPMFILMAFLMPAAVPPRPEATSPAADNASRWREFVAFVGTEQKLLASHLGATAALALPPAPLKISVAERHHLGFLQDADNLAALRELAKRFFAQEVTIQFVGGRRCRTCRQLRSAASRRCRG